MKTVNNKNLKWGVFTSPQSGDKKFERYVLESLEDVLAFKKAFPIITKFNMLENFLKVVTSGGVVLVTDCHALTKFPTWCIQSTKSDHPSSINRVKLGKTEI